MKLAFFLLILFTGYLVAHFLLSNKCLLFFTSLPGNTTAIIIRAPLEPDCVAGFYSGGSVNMVLYALFDYPG